MNALPGMEAPVPVEEVMSIAVGGGGTMRQPRPRNKMGRRPSWSEAEVLAAVMAILQHPEGTSRGPEAISVWHQQLRDTFMGRFRSLASTTPSLAAREDVWANRSARKIISEARAYNTSVSYLDICETVINNIFNYVQVTHSTRAASCTERARKPRPAWPASTKRILAAPRTESSPTRPSTTGCCGARAS